MLCIAGGVLLEHCVQVAPPVMLPIPRADGSYSSSKGQYGMLVFMTMMMLVPLVLMAVALLGVSVVRMAKQRLLSGKKGRLRRLPLLQHQWRLILRRRSLHDGRRLRSGQCGWLRDIRILMRNRPR